jgi:tetratricopeptide (TPR) repeat protein
MRKSKNLFIVSFLVSLITILVYLPALQNDFVNWDDNEYVYENPNIQSIGIKSIKWMLTAFHSANWHPVTWFSHAIDYAIWGLNPMGHHLTSVIFHGLNTILVVVLITHLIRLRNENSYQLGYSLIAGAITGLLFGLHPLHVESVAWVSERKDVLYAFFFLLSILMYIKYVSTQQGRKVLFYGLCLGFFILSLMSKPMAITLPAVLLILDFYPFRRFDIRLAFSSHSKILMEKLPFLGLSIVSMVLTVLAQQEVDAIKSLQSAALQDRIFIAFRGLIFYIYKMLYPKDLVPLYPYPSNVSIYMVEYAVSIILVLGITACCFYLWGKQKIWLTVWTYYVITLLPVLGIIQVGDQAAADRYTYLTSLSPFLLIGLGVARLIDTGRNKKQFLVFRRLFSIVIVAAIFGLLINLTVNQGKLWKNSITLWTRELQVFPSSAYMAYYKLGLLYRSQGLAEKAVENYRMAIKLYPTFTLAHYNLGNAYMSQGLIDKAKKQYQIVLELKPDFPDAHYNLGSIYQSQGLIDEAKKRYQIVLELKPDFPEAYNNLGKIYKSQGLMDKAMEHYKIARKLNEALPESYNNIGAVYQYQGFIDKAIQNYKYALKLKPDFAIAHYNLGLAYQSKGLMEKADKHFGIAQRLNPTLLKGMKSQH